MLVLVQFVKLGDMYQLLSNTSMLESELVPSFFIPIENSVNLMHCDKHLRQTLAMV